MNKRVHLVISGRVQGVWFRASTKERADELGLAGWVRNLVSGDVEAVAEGRESDLRQFVSWCHKGPRMADVTDVRVTYSDGLGEFDGFEVTG